MSSEDPAENAVSSDDFPLTIDFGLDKSPAISGEIDLPAYDVRARQDLSSKDISSVKRCLQMDFRELVTSPSSATYATHRIHKHPAVFIPQIPRHIIETYSTKNDEDGDRPLIFDPFSGSGTAGLEAKLLGRDYLGVEINPLSKLVSEVKVQPIPPSLANQAKQDLIQILKNTENGYHANYDPEFLDTTNKELWFEPKAINGLTRIRKALDDFDIYAYDILSNCGEFETKIIQSENIDRQEVQSRLYRWFVLMIANTVYEVSNADPGISKAYRSPKMKDLINEGKHPPDPIQVFTSELNTSFEMLEELWHSIYESTEQAAAHQDNSLDNALDENPAHKAVVDIRSGDAREFSDPDYQDSVDLAITSPPYINAINYYRGTKLRLFWIHDLMEEIIDSTDLRQSFVGTNSVSIRNKENLPKTTLGQWNGTTEEFQSTSLSELDQTILDIHSGELSEAKRRAYTTWKFFNVDMVRSLTRTYELLKPGAHFFLVIGENTIGGHQIQSHKYLADIAQNLGKFNRHGGNLSKVDGYHFIGYAWDEISNRALFQDRNHSNGVIEGEWVVILQKPRP